MQAYHWVAIAIVLLIVVGWYFSRYLDSMPPDPMYLPQARGIFPTEAVEGDLFMLQNDCFIFTKNQWIVVESPDYEMMRIKRVAKKNNLSLGQLADQLESKSNWQNA